MEKGEIIKILNRYLASAEEEENYCADERNGVSIEDIRYAARNREALSVSIRTLRVIWKDEMKGENKMPGKDKLMCVGRGNGLCDYGYNCSPDKTRTPCQRCGHEKHEIERRKKLLETVGLRKSGKTLRLFV